MTKIKGWELDRAYTQKSWYDGDSIVVGKGNRIYRVTASELLKMFDWFKFEVAKKRVHSYLVNPELVPDSD